MIEKVCSFGVRHSSFLDMALLAPPRDTPACRAARGRWAIA